MQQKIPDEGDLAWSRHQEKVRRDIVRAYAVEIGIGLAEVLGTREAARFLRKHLVTLDVALRVLLRADQRREYDKQDKHVLDGLVPVNLHST